MTKLYIARGGLLAAAAALITHHRKGVAAPAIIGRHKGRALVNDVAFSYRMPAGFPGDISRHNPPGTVEPGQNNADNPVLQFGQACMADGATNTIRRTIAADDAADSIYGISVRPYPFQQATASGYSGAIGFGQGSPGLIQPLDVLRSGYIISRINPTGGAQPQKGGRVFVWVDPDDAGNGHYQGFFETAATAGSTIELDEKSSFQGGLDSNGNGEIAFNI